MRGTGDVIVIGEAWGEFTTIEKHVTNSLN